MMSRILIGALLTLTLLAGAVLLIWNMAYGVQDLPDPSEVADVRESHLYEDLGRAHATHRTWVSLLLRQAALGGLGNWFGPSATPDDVRAVELGFAVTAQAAYQTLPVADQTRLEAYARGMNAGLAAAQASLAPPLVILDADVARWEPWHGLAVERLVLWLYAVHPDSSADARLQERLAWSGGVWNHAWMRNDGSAGARLLTGASAVPVFQEVFIRDTAGAWRGSVLTVPGTVMAPVAVRPGLSWAFTLHPAIEALPPGTGESVEYDRVTVGLQEVLVKRERRPDDAMRLPGATADLRWAGLGAATDVSQWMAVLEDRSGGPWVLHTGDGVVRRSGEPVRVSGNPATVVQTGIVSFVSNAPAGASAGLAVAEQPSFEPASSYSPYAQERVRSFLSTIPDSVALGAAGTRALTYLRNWNVTFDAAEIGATLFDALDIPPDTLPGQPVARLNQAMDRLAIRLGPDPSRWRWADAHPQQLTFPGWTSEPSEPDSMLRAVRIFRDRYAPMTVHGAGHPTSLVWHATPGAPATSAWEGAIGARGAFSYRRPDIRYDAFLGRSMRLDHPIDVITNVP
jgi:hypothetical protein